MAKYTYNPPYNQWSGNRSDTLNKWKVNYKGSIATASALPDEGEFKGDTYNVLEDGSNYMWNGTSWDKLDANTYIGATSEASGIRGLVPPASSSERNKFLRGDGTYKDVTWSAVTGKPSTYPPSEHTHECEDITDLPEVLPQSIYIDPVNGNDANTGYSVNNALKTISAFKSRLENSSLIRSRYMNVYLAEGVYDEALTGVYGVGIIYRAPTTVGKAATVKDITSSICSNITLVGNFICNSIVVSRNGYLRFNNNCSVTFDKDLYTNTNTPGCLIYIYQNATCIIYSGSSVSFNIKGHWTVSDGIYHVAIGSVLCFWGTETWNVLENSSITGPQYRVDICSVGDGLSSSSLPDTGTAGYVDATSYVS